MPLDYHSERPEQVRFFTEFSDAFFLMLIIVQSREGVGAEQGTEE